MPTQPLRVRVVLASAASLVLSLGLAACDDGPADPSKAGDKRSVMEGGKAESEAGKKVEHAKERIDDAEKQLEVRDDEVFEKSQGEQVERGVP